MGCVQSSSSPPNKNISQPQPTTQADGSGQVQAPSQDQRPGRVSVTSYNGSLHAQSVHSPLSPVPEVPPGPPGDLGMVFIARYAYQARTAEDLSFEKGEQLIVSNIKLPANQQININILLDTGNRQHRRRLVDGKVLQDEPWRIHPQ